MFRTHPHLRQPSTSRQQLWRYYTAERLLDLMETACLFFTNVTKFDDQLEGRLTQPTRALLVRWYQQQHGATGLAGERSALEYEDFQKEFYASCWHMNNYESYLMWQAYADRGFAIRTNYERIRAALDDSKELVMGGVVQYVDYARDTTDVGNVIQSAIYKPIEYTDERELRFLLWEIDPLNNSLDRRPAGIRVQLRLDMLIDTIVVHPRVGNVPARIAELAEANSISITHSSLSLRSAG